MIPDSKHSYPPKQTTYASTQRDERAQGRHPTPRSVAPTPETLDSRLRRPYMEALIREAINTTHTDTTSTLLCEETELVRAIVMRRLLEALEKLEGVRTPVSLEDIHHFSKTDDFDKRTREDFASLLSWCRYILVLLVVQTVMLAMLLQT